MIILYDIFMPTKNKQLRIISLDRKRGIYHGSQLSRPCRLSLLTGRNKARDSMPIITPIAREKNKEEYELSIQFNDPLNASKRILFINRERKRGEKNAAISGNPSL